MNSKDIYKVVKKLVGPIQPVGETHTDNARYENLKTMMELVDELLSDLDIVASQNRHAHEYSRKRAGEHADSFMRAARVAVEDK